MHESKKLKALVQRNIKMYFKDKMLFFVSLITPLILVVLFLTFLGQTYRDSLLAFVPDGVTLPKKLINGFTGGWLFSSILATSSVTVAFCSNIMVNDKISHAINDFNLTPVRRTTMQGSYFLANFCTTLIIELVVFVVALIYLAIVGWFFSFVDLLVLLAVIFLNTSFGTLLASLVGLFLNSQGAQSGVCTLVSSMYGFICGAYLPLAQFSSVMRGVVTCLPGTYCTVLLRRYFLRGTLTALGEYLPPATVDAVASSFDGTLTAFGHLVPVWLMYLIIVVALLALGGIYFIITARRRKI